MNTVVYWQQEMKNSRQTNNWFWTKPWW